jgi:hypothetical protein
LYYKQLKSAVLVHKTRHSPSAHSFSSPFSLSATLPKGRSSEGTKEEFFVDQKTGQTERLIQLLEQKK